VLAMAGPTDGLVGGPMANYQGDERYMRVKDLPKDLCPPGRTRLLNDLEAATYGVHSISQSGKFAEKFKVLWFSRDNQGKGPVTALDGGHAVILSPGTGLGNALLAFDSFSRTYGVLPLEFGHTSVATVEDQDLLSLMSEEVARGNCPVEWDDVCSGRGLVRMYKHIIRFNSDNNKVVDAAEIARKARDGDKYAQEAMLLNYKFLMRIASQLSMGFVPKFVVLVGDNQVSNAFLFKSHRNVEELRAEFLSHSMERYGFMSRVTVIRQDVSVNLNLVGCALVASKLGASKL